MPFISASPAADEAPIWNTSIMGVINSKCVKELSKLNQWLINSGYVKELPKRTRNNNPTINSGCVKELYPNLLVMTIPVHCCVSQFPVNGRQSGSNGEWWRGEGDANEIM